MSLIAAAKISTRNTRFVSLLAAAIVLHGLVLLLPAQRGLNPGQVLQRLSVTVQRVAAPEREAEAVPALPAPASAPSSPAAAPPATEAAKPSSPEPPVDAGRTEPAPASSLSAARLLDDAFRMRWESPGERESRRLGEAAGPAERPDPAARDRLLRDSGIEVVDRWRSADGSHNVLVRTASGGVLCGRAEAWDPLRPLNEPVMMWRDCGDGEPTFEWPESYRNSAPRPR